MTIKGSFNAISPSFASASASPLAYYKFYAEKKTAEGKVGQTDTEYNLWCFHPGFSLSSLIGCKIRTLILTMYFDWALNKVINGI